MDNLNLQDLSTIQLALNSYIKKQDKRFGILKNHNKSANCLEAITHTKAAKEKVNKMLDVALNKALRHY